MTSPLTHTTLPTAVRDLMIALRRDLHRHPELAWGEHETARRVGTALTELGLAVRQGVGRTGIVAQLDGPPGVPAVALRADMDALPIQEETGLPFASERDGVMHACGHDGHVSMLVGAAALLAAGPAPAATVRLLFQPAEEIGEGATAMIAGGALDGVGMVFGAHLDRLYPPGEIVVAAGTVNASTDTFIIEVTGTGGHAARPHEGSDPVVVGSLLVTALQSVVAREVAPTRPAVVTVGRFEAGSAPNVLARRARLEGTLRAHEPEVRALLRAALSRIAHATAASHGADVSVTLHDGTPPVVNTPAMAELARGASGAAVGGRRVPTQPLNNMGGEDFGYYLQHVPGCFVRIGARPENRPSFPAHSSRFDFDERALAVGAAFFYHVAHAAAARLADTAARTPN